jgi:K+-sensing histidine kinase KdpD
MMVDAPGSLPLVEADPSAVAHALRNLVANIGWRAHTGASLQVHAEQRDPERGDAARVVCVLSDETGTLGPSDVDVLFELPGGDSFPGIASYGIGMFVAARLIEAMDGRLEASMRDDGVVSIRIDLPVYPAGASVA